jgi:hypothetical protein
MKTGVYTHDQIVSAMAIFQQLWFQAMWGMKDVPSLPPQRRAD